MKNLFIGLLVGMLVSYAGLSFAGRDAQPHMRAALMSLQAAQSQLQKASPDKGGHRAKALSLTNQAIAETKKAIAYDNQHEKKDPR